MAKVATYTVVRLACWSSSTTPVVSKAQPHAMQNRSAYQRPRSVRPSREAQGTQLDLRRGALKGCPPTVVPYRCRTKWFKDTAAFASATACTATHHAPITTNYNDSTAVVLYHTYYCDARLYALCYSMCSRTQVHKNTHIAGTYV